MPKSAIITADIVNSTSLGKSREKKLIQTLGAMMEEHRHEFFRGDSFQVYVKDPVNALRIALQARAIARSISSGHDIRTSVGIGEVNSPLRSLQNSSGEAFVLSGRKFDEMTNDARIILHSPVDNANIALRVIGFCCDFIFKRLTPKQAAVINLLLQGKTQVETGKKLKISQATVNRHAKTSGWWEIDKMLKEYTLVLTNFKLT